MNTKNQSCVFKVFKLFDLKSREFSIVKVLLLVSSHSWCWFKGRAQRFGLGLEIKVLVVIV